MPRPQIIGTVVRRVDLNHSGINSKGGRSDKDYRITISVDATGVYHLYTEYGPAGHLQNGAEVILITAPPLHVAENKANELIKAKQTQRDAYSVVSDQRFANAPQAPNIPPPPPPSSKPVAKPRVSIETLSAPSRQLLNNLF